MHVLAQGSTLFDTRMTVRIDFMVQEVLMRAPKARKMLRFRQTNRRKSALPVL